MKSLINYCVLLVFFVSAANLKAQDEQQDSIAKAIEQLQSDMSLLKKLKISGYLQFQGQFADSSGVATFAGGNFPVNTDKRFQVRRGRLKLAYSSNPLNTYVVQFDITESGFKTKDVYAKLTDPFVNVFTFTGGVFNRPWGFEIEYSSSSRESPERARFNQTIYKDERDLGAMLTIQAPKTSRLNLLKLDLGVFTGNAINPEFDQFKDFYGRLNFAKSFADEAIKVSGDLSYNYGGFANQTSTMYKFWVDETGTKRMSPKTIGKFTRAKREMYGADLQVTMQNMLGLSTFRFEYAQGQQPALKSDATTIALRPASDAYIRQVNGYYVYFVQSLFQTRHSFVLKYDVFDPNTQVAGSDINAANGFTSADVKYSTFGLGYAFRFDSNTKIVLYKDWVTNEKTNLSGYTNDLKDNVVTLRLQYKF